MNISATGVNASRGNSRDLSNPKSTHIEAIREVGKLDRLAFTDAIQQFNEYIDDQGEGASRPDLAYINFTKSVYAPFGLNLKLRQAKESGIQSRDTFDNTELTFLQAAERMAAETLEAGMKAGLTRTAIKKEIRECSGRLAGMLKHLSKIREGAQ